MLCVPHLNNTNGRYEQLLFNLLTYVVIFRYMVYRYMKGNPTNFNF